MMARIQALAAQQQQQNGSSGGSHSPPVRIAAEQPPAAAVQWGGCAQAVKAVMAAAPPFRLREGRRHYLRNIGSCMQALHDGESYEVCLTTQLSRRGAVPPAEQLYRTLRRVNPAPYAGEWRGSWLGLAAAAAPPRALPAAWQRVSSAPNCFCLQRGCALAPATRSSAAAPRNASCAATAAAFSRPSRSRAQRGAAPTPRPTRLRRQSWQVGHAAALPCTLCSWAGLGYHLLCMPAPPTHTP